MRKNGTSTNNANSYGGGGSSTAVSERQNYHNPPTSGTDKRQCDSCRYRVPLNECTTFRCKDCGTYIVSEILIALL